MDSQNITSTYRKFLHQLVLGVGSLKLKYNEK